MKFNKFLLIIAFFIALMNAFGFYIFWNSETLLSSKHLTAIAISFLITYFSFCGIALKTTYIPNETVNQKEDLPTASDFSVRVVTLIKTISFLYLFVGLITLILLSIFVKSGASLIFGFGIETIIFLIIGYGISKSGQ